MQIHHASIITAPPLVSWCLTGEEDRAPGDKKEEEMMMRHVCEGFYEKHPLKQESLV